MKKRLVLEYLKGIPKSLYFNIKYFGLKRGLKLPILLSSKVKLIEMKGKINLDEKINKIGMIRIGFPSCGIFDYSYSRSIWQVEGTVIFKGKAILGQGIKFSVDKDGKLEFGNEFSCTGESEFICYKNIKFGDNCLVSWGNLFMDTDFHKIITQGLISNLDKVIEISNKSWIGSRCTILKGTKISENTVVASNSLLVNKYEEGNIILGGNPAKKIKENITWEI